MTDRVRRVPIQVRSLARLESIESAARVALTLHGRDRVSTAHVAEIAGCSIGSVYRYFPDRVALLDRVWPDRDLSTPPIDAVTLRLGDQIVVSLGSEFTLVGDIAAISHHTLTLLPLKQN